jgi:hypothetical protein
LEPLGGIFLGPGFHFTGWKSDRGLILNQGHRDGSLVNGSDLPVLESNVCLESYAILVVVRLRLISPFFDTGFSSANSHLVTPDGAHAPPDIEPSEPSRLSQSPSDSISLQIDKSRVA